MNFVFLFTSGLFLPIMLEDVEEGMVFNLLRDLKDEEVNYLISLLKFLELKNIIVE